MEIIIEEKQIDTIRIEYVNDSHFIVGLSPDCSYLLTRRHYNSGNYSFRCVNSEFSKGDHLCVQEFSVLSKVIKLAQVAGLKLHAFNTWQEAFQFLLDNDKVSK